MGKYYIASCVFTSKFPELSLRIQDYVRERFGFTVVRCCVPGYKIRVFEDKMPEGKPRECWRGLPDSGSFSEGDRVYSLCHNCNNIIEEMHPGVEVHSLWELIDSDPAFSFADHHELKAYIQDCWRSRDRKDEQDAVRSFIPHSPEEQKEIMRKYCRQFGSDKVVCYCHYCYEGLQAGGADAAHLAQMLF